MGRKRERLEIIYDILSVIRRQRNECKPTHILYKSNLSHQMMNEYLKELIDNGLVTEKMVGSSKFYSLTDKGFGFLEKYSQAMEFVKGFGL